MCDDADDNDDGDDDDNDDDDKVVVRSVILIPFWCLISSSNGRVLPSLDSLPLSRFQK